MNDFHEVVKSYTEHKKSKPAEEARNIVIDCRPNAIVGQMLVTKPKNEEESDEFIAAMIACIAELVSRDVGYGVEGVAQFLAVRFGEAAAELYEMDVEGEGLF